MAEQIPAWQWLCFNGGAVELLQKIHPNLIVKQRDRQSRYCDLPIIGQISKSLEISTEQKIAQFGVQCGKKIRALNSRQRNKRLLKTLKLKSDHLPLFNFRIFQKYASTVPFRNQTTIAAFKII